MYIFCYVIECLKVQTLPFSDKTRHISSKDQVKLGRNKIMENYEDRNLIGVGPQQAGAQEIQLITKSC